MRLIETNFKWNSLQSIENFAAVLFSFLRSIIKPSLQLKPDGHRKGNAKHNE